MAGTLPAPGAGPSPGLWRRAALIFTRPSQAWAGLGDRAAWWFPLLVVAIVSTLTMLAVYDRAYLPMMTENVERQAADGRMTQQQLDRAEAFFGGPAGRAINAGFQLAGVVIVTLLVALASARLPAAGLGRPAADRVHNGRVGHRENRAGRRVPAPGGG